MGSMMGASGFRGLYWSLKEKGMLECVLNMPTDKPFLVRKLKGYSYSTCRGLTNSLKNKAFLEKAGQCILNHDNGGKGRCVLDMWMATRHLKTFQTWAKEYENEKGLNNISEAY